MLGRKEGKKKEGRDGRGTHEQVGENKEACFYYRIKKDGVLYSLWK
jgi:hypothetical protein